MSRREPMAPVTGLKKPTLPAPRPRALAPVPEPAQDTPDEQEDAQPAPPASTPSAGPAAGPTRTEDDSSTAPSRQATRTRKSRAEKPSTAGRSATVDATKPPAISVSVPLTLAEAWRDRARTDRTSQVDVLLDAIVAHQGELTELVAARAEKPTVTDGLFDRTPGAKGERYVGVSLRIKATNLDVIDRLTNKHGADSRSQLIAAALSAHLG